MKPSTMANPLARCFIIDLRYFWSLRSRCHLAMPSTLSLDFDSTGRILTRRWHFRRRREQTHGAKRKGLLGLWGSTCVFRRWDAKFVSQDLLELESTALYFCV
ncbi:hypothetical protein F441_20612 [Phytophthora nicotianae CJ01A1]|uniref:Uncharacterized protein n=1 Tax=Phytophthora nicotianae CJ01A1 TaxID=1317063 RepID=W2VVV2_PHYNI|nr:hypothetical protein F441_20612 [Phytophthora nicotianae CJ01A1]